MKYIKDESDALQGRPLDGTNGHVNGHVNGHTNGYAANGVAPVPVPTDSILIAISDMDGTIIKSYDSMRIVARANESLPDIIINAIASTDAEAADRAAAYFAEETPHPVSGAALSKVDMLFVGCGHKNILHRSLETFNCVVATAVEELKERGIITSQVQESQIYNQAGRLRSSKLSEHSRMSTAAYPGFSDYIRDSSARGVVNAVYTNTEVTMALLRLHDAHENGRPIELTNIHRVMAKRDEHSVSLNPHIQGGDIQWNSSAADFERVVDVLRAKQVDVDALDMNRLREIYDLIRPYEGNKPNPEPIRAIVREFAAGIEEAVNSQLEAKGHPAPAFKITPRNVLMIGESKSDMDSTVATNDKGVAEPVARFALQWQGVQQHQEAIAMDAHMRGKTHVFGPEDALTAFGHAKVLSIAQQGLVLEKGYQTLNEAMNRNPRQFGYRTPALPPYRALMQATPVAEVAVAAGAAPAQPSTCPVFRTLMGPLLAAAPQ